MKSCRAPTLDMATVSCWILLFSEKWTSASETRPYFYLQCLRQKTRRLGSTWEGAVRRAQRVSCSANIHLGVRFLCHPDPRPLSFFYSFCSTQTLLCKKEFSWGSLTNWRKSLITQPSPIINSTDHIGYTHFIEHFFDASKYIPLFKSHHNLER